MNKLIIDTTTKELIKINLLTDRECYGKEIGQRFGSQVLLSGIQDIISEAGIELHDLTEIEVSNGPGSFTGIRVGVSVANALAYALGIKVNGKQIETDLRYN